jgi:CrcB protein
VKYLLIGAGGCLGAIARYQVATAIDARFSGAFPWATFIVNMSGCLIMGAVMTVLADRFGLDEAWRSFLVIGFLGAYTTFSSFEFDLFRAHSAGETLTALIYAVASVVVGYAALWVGVAAARLIIRPV